MSDPTSRKATATPRKRASAPSRPVTPGRGRPRDPRKRGAILEAALAAFQEGGYHGASLDAIAARAGVSKPTVYSHFTGKEALFAAVLAEVANRVIPHLAPGERDPARVEEALREVARTYCRVLLTPAMLELHRLGVAEAGRFPEIGRLYYESGPARSLEGIERMLRDFHEAGVLQIDEPSLASRLFYGLTLAPARTLLLLRGRKALSQAEIERLADEGVRVFLRAYAPEQVTGRR